MDEAVKKVIFFTASFFGGAMRGLYIHIPFCIKKCKYCDFTSFAGREDLFFDYSAKICDEMSGYKGEKIDSIFIGGGTPSLLDISDLKLITDSLYKTFDIEKNCEFTMESNPKTLSDEKLYELRKMGVNRLSIGVQSFNDEELFKIGRIHNEKDAENAVISAKKAGFSNINIDLMFSLPGQIADSFKKTLKTAVDLDVQHISCYSLILEEGTPLFEEYERNEITLPDEECDREMYKYACRELAKSGFLQYEISNFAKNSFECKHNLKYWNCDEYIGLGVAAHSYFENKRFFNTNSVEKYLKGEYREAKKEKLTIDDKIKEFVIMGLRKTEGISKTEFYERFNKDFDKLYEERINKFKKLNLIDEKGDFIFLTFEGINVSNSVLCEFV